MNTKVLGRRVVALILDTLILGALIWGVFFLLAGDPVEALRDGDVTGNTTIYGNLEIGDKTYSVYGGKAALWFAFGLLAWLANYVFLQGLRGYTLGKAIVGLRVVKDDGTSPPGIGRAFGRTFLFIADAFPYFIPYLTGFVVALVRKDDKRIGDMVASTLVVDKDSVGAGLAVPADATPSWVEGTRPPG